MRREDIQNIYPLSPMQQLMLTHARGLPGSYTLSNQFLYRISGPLSTSRFDACLAAIQQRHDALRSSFLWDGLREPMQVVHKKLASPLKFVDLSGLSVQDQQTKRDEVVSEDRLQVFDLTKAPLSRFTLVRLAEERHELVWSRHHMILDRWCVDILFTELFAMYGAPDPPDDTTLPQPGQFGDYIGWLNDQGAADARTYWARTLREVNRPSLIAPPGGARSAYASAGVPQIETELPQPLVEPLRKLAASAGVSLSVALQGALALVLAARDGAETAVFGITVSGRPADLPNVESTMGTFINNVPATIPLDEALTLKPWLVAIQSAQAERSRFDYLSPAEIRAAGNFAHGVPSFDLLALFDSPPTEVREGPGFEIEQISSPVDSALPVTLSLADSAGALRFTAAYDPGRVQPATVNGLLAALADCISGMLDTPDATIGELRGSCFRNTDLALITPPAATVAAPRPASDLQTDDHDTLLCIWQETLGVDAVGLDDDFFALGGTSVQAVELFAEIERRLGSSLPMSVLFEAGSVRALLQHLNAPAAPMATLVSLQSRGDKTPLYVVPGIGGDPVSMSGLARALGPEQPLFSFLSRGLDGFERPMTKIEDMAAQNIRAMEARGVSEPVVLCGICWGSFVALEMARQLSRDGRPPKLLVVFDPALLESGAAESVVLHPWLAKVRFVQGRLRGYWAEFHTLESGSRLDWVRGKVGTALNAVAGEAEDGAQVRTEIHREAVMSANLKAQLRYRPDRYEHDVRLLLTADRDLVADDPRLVWAQLVAPDAPVTYVPGTDTGQVLAGANVRAFADVLRDLLDSVA